MVVRRGDSIDDNKEAHERIEDIAKKKITRKEKEEAQPGNSRLQPRTRSRRTPTRHGAQEALAAQPPGLGPLGVGVVRVVERVPVVAAGVAVDVAARSAVVLALRLAEGHVAATAARYGIVLVPTQALPRLHQVAHRLEELRDSILLLLLFLGLGDHGVGELVGAWPKGRGLGRGGGWRSGRRTGTQVGGRRDEHLVHVCYLRFNRLVRLHDLDGGAEERECLAEEPTYSDRETKRCTRRAPLTSLEFKYARF